MMSSTVDPLIFIPPKASPTAGTGYGYCRSSVGGKLLSTSAVAGFIGLAASVFNSTDAPTFQHPQLDRASNAQSRTTAVLRDSGQYHFDGGQLRIDSVLARYETGDLDLAFGQNLLATDKGVLLFLEWFPDAVREVYGRGGGISLRALNDLEAGAQVIDVRVFSGLELGDEFDSKDAKLFEMIEDSGLFSELQNVIVSQG